MVQTKDSQIIPNFVFRRDLNIGSAAAENDEEFLKHCFVDTGVKSLIMDHSNKKCVLVGRVGSGKSAILKRIEDEAERCIRINPTEFSLLYLDRSNIIQIINNLGLKIEPLLEALWQHVLCVEYIKLRYMLTNPDKYKRFWNRLVQSVFADEAKKAALEYFNEWGGGDFWETTEARVTELTKKISTQLSAKLGTDLFSKLEASGASQNSFSDEEKVIIENQLKSVIGGSHLHKLHKVMDILSNDQNTGKPIEHFILIDDLDGRFLEGGGNYSLVAALFESIKRLRAISCLRACIESS